MNKCPKCDSIISEGQAFCTFCGETFLAEKKQELQEAPPPPPPPAPVTDPVSQQSVPPESPSPAAGQSSAPPVIETKQGMRRVCPKCRTSAPEDQMYCTNCGEPLKEGLPRRNPQGSSRASYGKSIDKKHRKRIKSSRTAIAVVAILTWISALVHWILLKAAMQESYIPKDEVNQNYMLMGVTVFLGLVFMVLNFWAKQKPFAATLTALIIYLTDIVVLVAIDPVSLIRGIVVKVIIVVILLNGVRSSFAFRHGLGGSAPASR